MERQRKNRQVMVSVLSLVVFMLISVFLNFVPSRNPDHSLFEPPQALAAEQKITNASVNLRTGPGTQYSVILTIPKDSPVTVTGYSGSWSEVTYNGKSGYSYSTYLSSMTTKYASTNLNFRTGPGTGYSIIQPMPQGTAVNFISSAYGWSKILYNGKVGYASSTYLASAIKYTTAYVNFRTGPGTGYSIILTIPKGSTVYFFSSANGWSKIMYSSKSGYVSSSYIADAASAPLPPAPTPEPAPTPTPPPPDPVPVPTPDTGATLMTQGITSYNGKRIAITFDDYSDAYHIHSILNILDQYGAKSTFFLLGEWINANQSLAREIITRGHEIQSHSYNHLDLSVQSESVIRNQLTDSISTIKKVTNTTPVLLRPPYGEYNSTLLKIAGEVGFSDVVIWTVDSHDWASTMSGVNVTADYVYNRVVTNATNNGIVCMHAWPDKTLDALPRILANLKSQGYSFVKVTSMIP